MKKYKPYKKKKLLQQQLMLEKLCASFSSNATLVDTTTTQHGLDYSSVANELSDVLSRLNIEYDSDTVALKSFQDGYESDLN